MYRDKKPFSCKLFTLLPLLCGLAVFCFAQQTRADDYFNPALLDIDNPRQEKTDLSVYEKGPGQAPGKYQVSIFIDNNKVDTRDVTFKLQKDVKGNRSLQPCFSLDDLKSLGIKTKAFPKLMAQGKCADLSVIPAASATFRVRNQQLLLSIPQSALGQIPRGYIDPKTFDEGITAGLLNYSANASQSDARRQGEQDNSSQYVNLRPGFNIGAWRVRNYSTWNRNVTGHDEQQKFSSVYTYAQRDIVAMKSDLTVGQSASPADVFDSVPYTGVQLNSDSDMLPDSEKGYAPIIRGTAHSNALVMVRQNGYVIYQNTVAPGAFEINDLYPTGSSGDLQVTVKETDGSESHFVVPYASVPVLQREKNLRYSVTAGRYRAYDKDVEQTPFAQGSAIYGLPYGFTAYGGVQQSRHYQSQAIGTGKNLGDLGAFSVDVTRAKALLKQQQASTGQSWRVRYSKDFAGAGTNFSLAGYRYNSKGFYTLEDTMESYTRASDWSAPQQRRARTEATVDQTLGESWGSFTLSLVKETYWSQRQDMTSMSLSYNNSWHGVSYSLSYSMNKNTSDSDENGESVTHDNQFALSVSVPLDHWMHNTWATYNLNNSQDGTTQNIGLNGTALAEDNLNWNIQEGVSNTGSGNSTSMNADYKGTYGEVSGGVSQDSHQRSVNMGLQGGVVAHANGITLTQPLGETIALVKAPGTHGTHITNQTGVKTDFRGYTVVPFVSAYRHNTIALDTETLPDDADVTHAARIVTPTRGAVVRASFNTRVGSRVLMMLTQNGKPLPFGATVTTDDKDSEFIVGNGGQTYLSGLPQHGTLFVSWGQDASEHCVAEYTLTDERHKTSIINAAAQCH
ncbi:fimbria/pilus outer membrane usher protein [Citrobacter koseri]|uniref:fimbria/pilus outer membrane usher protein n=1 Tax=Citrobacter koseri TaxID=545 RepID=UPI0023B197DF|nr:fimbria/pilus outer membrane usher protein [Citrobacter koseri]EKU0539297.1 fimbrial biogenesis outer membrane usher protein [Citrobacter koseri]EKU8893578.1 fimbrial biogenesis outer membrane usher protein [Citrobacter koseri]MDT7451640.1 fimbria/pilus outer membrane usher protein [Citrobacter koseri]HCB3585406.1 fimbrial biogenesis outer membrane usher protein [Citrobacter koseri]HEM6796541.1 fimbrial biogenesis outer membrane usher protein [Citrobacter koseri]